MDTKRIESFKEFAKYLEYPMVVFEAETGHVLDINYEAEVLLGKKAETIHIEPGRALMKLNFWEMLHGKKSLIWHRIRLVADDKEYLVSGLVNEATVNDILIYTLLFERRADLNIGSLTLEQIVNHAGIVAVHMGKAEDGFQVEYVSQNINQYGYTRAQFYEKLVDITELICREDAEKINKAFAESVAKHTPEDSFECRLFTEEREMIPVRLLVHYVYNDYGSLTDLEILIMDLKEEQRRNSENAYLSNAITKIKSVVLVKSYNAGKRTLKYVSPNAGMVGMNVEALRKGYKLTEDYIHPDDRDDVIDTIYQAVANGVTDYVQVYRMVRDDGRKIWVENEVTVNRISDGEAEISFLLTDITEQKDMEKELAVTVEDTVLPGEVKSRSSLSLVTIDREDKEMLGQFQLMADTLSRNADYYSVVLDAEGSLLTKPAGPEKELGQFYDLFERPQFREAFTDVSKQAREQRIPKSITLSMDSMEIHMIFAPLMIELNVTAYWVLTSFATDGMEVLSQVVEPQWRLANSIAESFYAEEVIQHENHLRKLLEVQVHKEQQERHVIDELICSLTREGEASLGEMCQKAGVYLSVSEIGLYLENKETQRVETYYVWNQAGDDTVFASAMEMTESEYQALQRRFVEQPVLVTDKKTEEPFFRELVRHAQVGAMLMVKLPFAAEGNGYLVMADVNRNREFDKRDIHLASSLAGMFAGVIQSKQKGPNLELIQEGFFDAYNHIRDAVFVKHNRSGDIVFANKAMDKLFGYSLVGMQAREVVNDQLEQYRNIQSVRKRFIADKKVTKWQSYMKELDQIMNIVEVRLETINGADYSLVILKKNKNKKKDS